MYSYTRTKNESFSHRKFTRAGCNHRRAYKLFTESISPKVMKLQYKILLNLNINITDSISPKVMDFQTFRIAAKPQI